MTSIQSPSSPIKYPDVVFPVEVNTFTLDYYKIDKVYDVLPKGEFTIVIIGRAFLPNGAQIFHLKMTGLNDDLGRVFVFWVTENAARGAFLIDPYILSNYEKYYGKWKSHNAPYIVTLFGLAINRKSSLDEKSVLSSQK